MTENKSKNHPAERRQVTVKEHRVLLDPGKSTRLREMRGRHRPVSQESDCQELSEQGHVPGLQTETMIQLKLAREMIDGAINEITRGFPEGKKKKLFNLRYGSVDDVKGMPIKAAFKLLGLDENRVKLKCLAGMDYYGNKGGD